MGTAGSRAAVWCCLAHLPNLPVRALGDLLKQCAAKDGLNAHYMEVRVDWTRKVGEMGSCCLTQVPFSCA